jgi:hypothetical protein
MPMSGLELLPLWPARGPRNMLVNHVIFVHTSGKPFALLRKGRSGF